MDSSSSWLALMIGNSRLHWAWFAQEKLCHAWDTQYLPNAVVPLSQFQTDDVPIEVMSVFKTNQKSTLPLYLASVVPSQTAIWQSYPNIHVITLDQVPLQNVYPKLGIDRALALWGAGVTYGLPMLVIDAGTALTLTGANGDRSLVGGAILPGLSLQFQSLAQKAAELSAVDLPQILPTRWALNTPAAIQSGIIYTIIAGLRDFIETWRQQFPESNIALTGGDRVLLLKYLQAQFPQLAAKVITDSNLIFWGMKSLIR